MSDETPTNIFDDVKNRVEPLGGNAWIDELLLRGDASGISGAHLVIGWSAPGVMGATQTGVTNPQPLTLGTNDPLWEAVKTEINAVSVQQLLDAQSQVAQLQSLVEQLQQDNAALVVEVERLTPKEEPSGN